LEKTLPKKNKWQEISIFYPAVITKNYLNSPPSEMLWKEVPFLSLCQFWQQDHVANNDTLAKNLDAKYGT
jgi:hypothetical protein